MAAAPLGTVSCTRSGLAGVYQSVVDEHDSRLIQTRDLLDATKPPRG